MEEGSVARTVERIEAALARVDAASRHTDDLHRRHAKLKARVARSLVDLDAVLARPPE